MRFFDISSPWHFNYKTEIGEYLLKTSNFVLFFIRDIMWPCSDLKVSVSRTVLKNTYTSKLTDSGRFVTRWGGGLTKEFHQLGLYFY